MKYGLIQALSPTNYIPIQLINNKKHALKETSCCQNTAEIAAVAAVSVAASPH